MEAAHAVSLSGLFGAHMRLKFFVALLLVAFLPISGIEPPLGGPVGLNCHAQLEHAQPTETVFFNPDQLRVPLQRFHNRVLDL